MMILAATIACLMGNDGWLLASMMVGYNLGMTYAPLSSRQLLPKHAEKFFWTVILNWKLNLDCNSTFPIDLQSENVNSKRVITIKNLV